MLSTRIFTALIGIPLIFAGIYFGGIFFFIMMALISFFCVLEYMNITQKYNPHKILSLIMSVLFFVFIYFSSYGDKVLAAAIVMLFILFAVEVFGKNTDMCVARISVSFLGAFLLPLSLMYMVYIREILGAGMKLIFLIFITVWVLDTAAYAFGKTLGRHKLAPNVSPKKTIEGAVAGVVFGILTVVLCKYTFMQDILSLKSAIILGFVISIIGQFSDLAESLIKRDGQIKDSGTIIPGHGGFLDRFDSYIFAAPAVYYCLYFFK
ncbi:MAG: phosphatidate cytidylyltransferase [Endomicrobia bacterium]|nr:phosphatidate cytidylyltransferase [Endomicrobiia bacterium]MCL2507527.1 phosphatidate cytidylyltransferase [Endomicrobiia bacterium]